MKKRVISVLLMALLVLSLIPSTAFAEQEARKFRDSSRLGRRRPKQLNRRIPLPPRMRLNQRAARTDG